MTKRDSHLAVVGGIDSSATDLFVHARQTFAYGDIEVRRVLLSRLDPAHFDPWCKVIPVAFVEVNGSELPIAFLPGPIACQLHLGQFPLMPELEFDSVRQAELLLPSLRRLGEVRVRDAGGVFGVATSLRTLVERIHLI